MSSFRLLCRSTPALRPFNPYSLNRLVQASARRFQINRHASSGEAAYFPAADQRNNPQAWIDTITIDFDDYARRAGEVRNDIDHEAPATERQHNHWVAGSGSYVPLDERIAHVLVAAKQQTRTNLLCHLGLEKSEWSMVSWVVRAVTERPLAESRTAKIQGFAPISIENRSNLPQLDNTFLPEIADNEIWYRSHAQESGLNPQDVQGLAGSSISAIVEPNVILQTHASQFGEAGSESIRIQASGEILYGIGAMILHASTLDDIPRSQKIMSHVLDIFAILHHNDIVPRFTYQDFSSTLFPDRAAPAFLDDLFQPILSAILDAEWNLFQDSSELATYASGAQAKIEGYHFPDHNNPKRILPFAHEIWLELLLWICLRGGWFRSGLKILRYASTLCPENSWVAVSWRKAIPRSSDEEWVIPSRTLSSELLCCYADAVIAATSHNQGTSGNFTRDLSPELNLLRSFFERAHSAMHLDWALYSSQTLPDYTMSLKPFRKQIARVVDWTQQEPITISPPILCHNLARLFSVAIEAGELDLLSTLLEIMIKSVATQPSLSLNSSPQELQSTQVYQLLPADMVAHALQCALDTGMSHSGILKAFATLANSWSQSHGCIPEGAAIVLMQHASVCRDDASFNNLHALLLGNKPSRSNANIAKSALLCCQIEQRSWTTVASGVARLDVSDKTAMTWHARILISLAVAAIQGKADLDKGARSASAEEDYTVGAQLLRVYLTRLLHSNLASQSLSSIYTTIGMIACIDEPWRDIMVGILAETPAGKRQKIHLDAGLSPNLASILLSGISNNHGAEATQKVWDVWCQPVETLYEADTTTSAAGQSSETVQSQSKHNSHTYCVLSEQTQFVVRRKIKPNLSMIRALFQGHRPIKPGSNLWLQLGYVCSAFNINHSRLYGDDDSSLRQMSANTQADTGRTRE